MAVKPQYRLQALLKLREHKKEAAEQHLATCLGILKTEQERLQELEKELERMIAKREAQTREYAEKTMRGEMSARDAVGANVYIERLKEEEEAQKCAIESQQAVVAAKQEDVDGARKDLALATQELKALEKHREHWDERVKKDRQMREEEVMDEVAQSIFQRGKP